MTDEQKQFRESLPPDERPIYDLWLWSGEGLDWATFRQEELDAKESTKRTTENS